MIENLIYDFFACGDMDFGLGLVCRDATADLNRDDGLEDSQSDFYIACFFAHALCYL